ncbi:MAG: hypothetical protein HXY40_12510 [Chloroflexi bacterium]|nr:hypothetical protein [Chloroflexota bacterium]
MISKRVLWIVISAGIVIVLVALASVALAPQSTPAFDAALRFADAAGRGDDATATALLAPALLDYVRVTCPAGSVSACVRAYMPPEWGDYISVVYRRSALVGSAWDVQLIATYAENEGFSGVCIYLRMEADAAQQWRVTAWAGWVSCGDPASREMAANPDAPNRAP